MSFISSVSHPVAFRSFTSGAGSISRYYSKSRRALAPFASQRSRPFSRSRFVHAAANTSGGPSSKQAGKDAGSDTPSIKEKLPDPERTPFRFREFDLEGKVFVVTGGARGLGLVLSEALIEAGGQGQYMLTHSFMPTLAIDIGWGWPPVVYCLDRLPQPDKEFFTVQERLGPRYGGSLKYDKVDVREAGNLDRVIEEIATHHGRLDGLIAAAGVQNVTPALDYTPEQIEEMMNINYKGVFCSAVSCARQMIKHDCSGSILLVASMSGMVANKGFTSSVYNSSKAAVCQLARSLAMEWGKIVNGKPIRVNALCPGNIMTPMVRKNFEDDPKLKALWEKENMLGRISTPAEYRGAALFCLSDASSFMTGSNLVIDGGYTAW
ncbi:hypothetical protein AYL99_00696 [Fonsecaea erecta]|uniref:Uncharacterized protein n=1 Tax=Fonsecaea erecta TaxID=1367422 RepID=A0A178ZY27_9EURO|nr:hypothetical protein AYL99_00696 [Fonsecaea erecta]OAP64724.1 hypothetical protein AYL99_00696 [Fonsecaea erecta]